MTRILLLLPSMVETRGAARVVSSLSQVLRSAGGTLGDDSRMRLRFMPSDSFCICHYSFAGLIASLCAGVLLLLVGYKRRSNEFVRKQPSLLRRFSAFAYSVFVFHFPALLLIVAFSEKFVPTLIGKELPVTMLIVLVVCAYSDAFYLCLKRTTVIDGGLRT